MLIAVILKLTGEGKVFFLQERIGKNGDKFKLFKFATMVENSPYIGTGTVTMKDDHRILPVGVFLRKTKINELPQLLNIFFGDMSVIGPRPQTANTFEAYSENTQLKIQQVLPGLSGVGSIIFRDEEEIMNEETASIDFYVNIICPYKGELEEWFVLNKSLYIYFMAIFITAWAVLFPSTKLAWRVFKDLPEVPAELEQALNRADK